MIKQLQFQPNNINKIIHSRVLAEQFRIQHYSSNFDLATSFNKNHASLILTDQLQFQSTNFNISSAISIYFDLSISALTL